MNESEEDFIRGLEDDMSIHMGWRRPSTRIRAPSGQLDTIPHSEEQIQQNDEIQGLELSFELDNSFSNEYSGEIA